MFMIINFDKQDEWFPIFSEAIEPIAPRNIFEQLSKSQYEFTDDAGKFVIEAVGEAALRAHLDKVLERYRFHAFHGTRLTQDEVENIRENGLVSLSLSSRRSRYFEIFRNHPSWENVQTRLDQVLHRLGPGAPVGNREDGRVWACLSRAGVLDCHYADTGAEVDHHVAYGLFSNESAHGYLRAYGSAYIVRFTAQYQEIMNAFSSRIPDEGKLSDLVRRMLDYWAYSFVDPSFSIVGTRDAVQLGFNAPIQPNRIDLYEDVSVLMKRRA